MLASNFPSTAACVNFGSVFLFITILKMNDFSSQLFAGSVGAIASSLLLTPADVVKNRLQAASITSPNFANCVYLKPNHLKDLRCGCDFKSPGYRCMLVRNFNVQNTPVVHSTFGMIRHIYLNDGIRTFWSGLKPTLSMSIPT